VQFGATPSFSKSYNQCLCLTYCLADNVRRTFNHAPNSNSENEANLLLQNPSKQSANNPRAFRARVCPPIVGRTPEEARSRICPPKSCSNSCIWRVTADWEMCKRSAARRRLPSSMMTRNSRSFSITAERVMRIAHHCNLQLALSATLRCREIEPIEKHEYQNLSHPGWPVCLRDAGSDLGKTRRRAKSRERRQPRNLTTEIVPD
jgi:hypothetical protein